VAGKATLSLQLSIFLLFLLCWTNHSSAQHHNQSNTDQSICRPFGECEPCPQDALHEPFCQPFGNRRLMHCSPNTTAPSIDADHSPTNYPYPTAAPESHATQPPKSRAPQGETPAWQSCGRIPAQERADFYEFFACNVAFAAGALAIALIRSRRVETRQARRLAARIGLVRGG